ncbi:MaoC/PaaZ C-terminal domain-containing protein [Phyllobacterium sp. SB3]|uniref:MaoC/PaaZ C-terminal domain-containing protein n=1 Tax=Phyllobacterium sp. SB3 TaxID=3156073 RepID=UPI0032AE841D
MANDADTRHATLPPSEACNYQFARNLKSGPHLKQPRFDVISEGDIFGPARYVPDDREIEAYCYAVGCKLSEYQAPSGKTGQRLAPSCLVVKELMWLYQTGYDRARLNGLHQHEEIKFHRPVPAGTELVMTGRTTRKYVRRGKGYFVHSSEARGHDGTLYIEQVNTEILELPESLITGAASAEPSGRKITGDWPDGPVAVHPSIAVPGMRIPDGLADVDRGQMAVFSGALEDYRNSHTDGSIAKSCGFPDSVAQGLMAVCWLSEFMVKWGGAAFLSGGRISATFLKIMLPGDKFQIKGIVSQELKDTKAIEVEVAILNQRNEITMVAFVEIPVLGTIG